MKEQKSILKQSEGKIKTLVITAFFASLAATLIATIFVVSPEYPYDSNFFFVIGECMRNTFLSVVVVFGIYAIFNRKEAVTFLSKIDFSEKSTVKLYDSFSPLDGVNNPSSPACHHINSFNERNRQI